MAIDSDHDAVPRGPTAGELAARDAAALEHLSALVDGELDAAAARHVCRLWRDDGEARSSWHAYHLIGDVLRSDDLACTPARDMAFLAAFRLRLQTEPVVLAPQAMGAAEPETALPAQAMPGTRRSLRAWMAPSALAAGFVAIAGVLVLNGRPVAPTTALPQAALDMAPVAMSTGASPASPASAAPASVDAEPAPAVANGRLIRDGRLDRYLAAHKQFVGSSALGVPSGFLRNATASESDR